jgi:hypothetical protein
VKRSQHLPVAHTNRKGVMYYLCRSVTKTGKPRYQFRREPKGEPVEAIPQGFKISESVNGIVSLVMDRPAQILPEEEAAVEAVLHGHPKACNYRLAVKRDGIEVYERAGPDVEELIAELAQHVLMTSKQADGVRAVADRHARFTPVLRFVLTDAEERIFSVERRCYLGSIDGWIKLSPMGPIEKLARQIIPKLDSDAFFD